MNIVISWLSRKATGPQWPSVPYQLINLLAILLNTFTWTIRRRPLPRSPFSLGRRLSLSLVRDLRTDCFVALAGRTASLLQIGIMTVIIRPITGSN